MNDRANYLKGLMNHIYIYTITIQLDWMLKGTLLFFKV